MGVDQHFLGRHPNRRVRIGRQRIGDLDGLGVEGEGFLVVGLRAGGQQIAHQAQAPAP